MILISSTFPVSDIIVNGNNICFGVRCLPLFTMYNRSWAKELTFMVSGLSASSCSNMFKKRCNWLGREIFSEDSWDVSGGQDIFDFDDLISWRKFPATSSTCLCGFFSVKFFTVSWSLTTSIASFSLETVLGQRPFLLWHSKTFPTRY